MALSVLAFLWCAVYEYVVQQAPTGLQSNNRRVRKSGNAIKVRTYMPKKNNTTRLFANQGRNLLYLSLVAEYIHVYCFLKVGKNTKTNKIHS